MSLVHFSIWIESDQREALKNLKDKTRIPVSAFVREGIEYVIKKHGGKSASSHSRSNRK